MRTALDSETAQTYPPLPDVAMQNYARSKRLRQVGYILLVYGLAIPGAIMFLLPFLWMFSTSLKASNEIFILPPKWVPDTLHWENYTEALALAPFGLYLRNTLFIT